MNTVGKWVGVAVVGCALVACGGRSGTDGGSGGDGGPGPSGPIVFRTCDPVLFDAGPPPDLGAPAMCFGTPTMDCATRPAATCTMGMGCVVTQCRGFPVSCGSLTMTDCVAQTGCSWTGSACAGTGAPCTTITAMDPCTRHLGCVWSAMTSCGGVTTPCGMLDAAHCASQPGCTTTNPDAGMPLPDAGVPGCTPCSGTVTMDVRVVRGPEPVTPAGGALLHFESNCGPTMDATAGADGVAHVTLDRGMGSWTMTVGQRGYTAMSVVGVTDIELDGEVRLDPVPSPTGTEVGAVGVVSGAAASSMVQLDGYDFNTTMVGPGGTWNSSFYLFPWAVPLKFCAVELNAMGDAVNQVCSAEMPRTSMPVAGVSLSLPTPAATSTTSTVAFDLPTSGVLAGLTAGGAPVAQHMLALEGDPSVYVGSAKYDDASHTLTLRSFADFPVNRVYLQLLNGTMTGGVNVYVTDFSPGARYVIPALVDASVLGASLGDATLTGGGAGWDALVLNIGETMDPMTGRYIAAPWRVFVPLHGGAMAAATVPHLPAGVRTTDLQLTPGATSIALALKMASGRPWSMAATTAPQRLLQMSSLGNYVPLDPSGR